jgi:hypothetical protein
MQSPVVGHHTNHVKSVHALTTCGCSSNTAHLYFLCSPFACYLSQSLYSTAVIAPRLGLDRFLQNPCQFIQLRSIISDTDSVVNGSILILSLHLKELLLYLTNICSNPHLWWFVSFIGVRQYWCNLFHNSATHTELMTWNSAYLRLKIWPVIPPISVAPEHTAASDCGLFFFTVLCYLFLWSVSRFGPLSPFISIIWK